MMQSLAKVAFASASRFWRGGDTQVGAAISALCRRVGDRDPWSKGGTLCTSLKANVRHLEACTAAEGLASLVVTPLIAGLVATNAQLGVSAGRNMRGTAD